MAAPFNETDVVRKTYFIDASERDVSTPANDVGKVPQLEEDGRLSPAFQTATFGGDGSDGVLDTTSAPVIIDLEGENVVQKNYLNITVDTNDLDFSNPAAEGTIVFLRSLGDVTIASGAKINAKGIGAEAETVGFALYDESIPAGISSDPTGTITTGGAAAGAVSDADKKYLIFDPVADEWKLLRRHIRVVCGSGGGNGAPGKSASGAARGGGGGGGASYYTGPGSAGANGVTGSANGVDASNATNIGAGAGGGSGAAVDGGTGENNGTGGEGGRGGGALIIECGGNLIFEGEIDVSGEDGTDGGDFISAAAVAAGGGGGGGGGSAGVLLLLANKITTNTGVVTCKGGRGGDGGTATHSSSVTGIGGDGGDIPAGTYGGIIVKNKYV